MVCSFNSLDHVDDFPRAIAEVKRVVKRGGLFLMIVEVNHPAMVTEPVSIRWEDVRLFEDAFDARSVRRYEIGDTDIHGQLRRDDAFDPSRGDDRPGFLTVKFTRRGV